jgi:hypothetical protein
MEHKNSASQNAASAITEFPCQAEELAPILRKLGFTKIGRMRPWMFVRLKTNDLVWLWSDRATTPSTNTAALLAELVIELKGQVAR